MLSLSIFLSTPFSYVSFPHLKINYTCIFIFLSNYELHPIDYGRYSIITIPWGSGQYGSSFSDQSYYDSYGQITALRLYSGNKASG